MNVTPAAHTTKWQQDAQNNLVARVLFPERTGELSLDIELTAELAPINPFDFLLDPAAENCPFDYPAQLAKDLTPYLAVDAPAGPLMREFLREACQGNPGTVAFLMRLNQRVHDEISYVTRLESGTRTSEETLAARAGSCRDSAWLLVESLRHAGFAARFVSGYLIQAGDDSEEKDSVALHAWAEAYLPGAGWIGFDATSGLLTAEGHIPLACAREPSEAAPVSGSVEPCKVDFSYEMTARRVGQTARTRQPFSEDDWAAVERVANKVDRDLESGDARLTMGGEPTFVGIDEPDSPQWNGDALGPLKRNRAVTFIRRIQERIAPGALLHFGQGKWYPGEALPRWKLGCHWRIDGVALWERGDLIAEEDRDYGADDAQAREFIAALTRRLEVESANVLPVYEDAFYYLWRERRLPVNVDVSDSKLRNARERAELARVFERGVTEAVGYVLPIRRRQNEGRLYWSSQPWFVRPERLLLISGDSPVGYRLPIDSLPWVAPDEITYEFELDPFADREKLPARGRRLDLFEREAGKDPLPAEPQRDDSSEKTVLRPALAVEAREGRLHVFMPYQTKLADYVDLLAAVEDTCIYLNRAVWVEGYPPPDDPRVKSFSVTPDPGVIEVNLAPVSNWQELQEINSVVFEEAGKTRLTAEKFLQDGRRVATGGGNHITLGGPAAPDSPLLRRPDLLRSMVAFWQNHPSLSYLFSGAFIGPTSQYPRVDEARMDSLYELEIAFAQVPSGETPPWLVDRLFRNLLIDVTGNTHRAEFCIDKLYPPENAGMRLGLLELRAFEMSPHVRMQLVTLLLVRTLVATFWKEPYPGRLVRWGTALHDRFLLPHFVEQDFAQVLAHLRAAGYEFDARWFDAHFDFRFPIAGSIAAEGVRLELRHALEIWNVLGEEASGGGTVRTVDSSLERLQVKVSGLTERYAVACNGRRVPLHPTGKPGEAVAGVRFRAWRPVTCLHPRIPVHAPLAFDIVDQWNERPVGGCVYHVLPREGRAYADRPANAAEAERRREERFDGNARTSGRMELAQEDANPYFPMTLDLRWPGGGELVPATEPPGFS